MQGKQTGIGCKMEANQNRCSSNTDVADVTALLEAQFRETQLRFSASTT